MAWSNNTQRQRRMGDEKQHLHRFPPVYQHLAKLLETIASRREVNEVMDVVREILGHIYPLVTFLSLYIVERLWSSYATIGNDYRDLAWCGLYERRTTGKNTTTATICGEKKVCNLVLYT